MINQYLPEYHFNEIHSRIIKAPASRIYSCLRRLDFSASVLSRVLFKLRGLDTKNMSLDKMVDSGSFFTINEKVNQEWLVGLLAESFRKAHVLAHDEDYTGWNPGHGVKIAWNFLLHESQSGQITVSTETRIQCLNKKSKLIFTLYWFFVRPFSGLIRLEMLRILKNKCEV